ncbi:MAG: hemolysin family protein [Actinomycetota bacterium]|nr:hemolysin family protein [Actinomycetota bacterium]
MSEVLPQLGLVIVLVIVNAAFAGTELALVSLREGQLQRLETSSSRGAVLARLARQPNQFLATIQIGITLAGFLASAAAAVSLAEPLEGPLDFLGDAAGPTAIVLVTLVLSYVTLVFGELAPKRVAMQRAERWGLTMARPLAVMSRITRPAVWLLSHSTNLAVRLLGGDPDRQREEITEEELRELVAAQTHFTPEQRVIIDGAFEIAQRRVDQVLVPRSDVFVLDADWTHERALRELAASGHSRAPVAPARNLDQFIGVVHLRQLLDGDDAPVSASATDAPVFPAGAHVLAVMRELQTRRVQMAVVANEHGGTEGLVTIEDLVEELVGEIYDETDRDLATVRHQADGVIDVPGRLPIHDLGDIDVDLPAGDYATIAGLVLDRLGRIPTSPGDVVVIDGWELEVRGVRHRTITEVRLRRRSDPSTEVAR